MRINVTRSYLPPKDKIKLYIDKIWENEWLTNNGPLVQQLEQRLKDNINNDYLLYTNNGTVVLQIAIKSLNLTKEIVTTPFSYVATTNAILWEKCTPVFVDINPVDFNIDVSLIEKAITSNTEAILATHVFGNPCSVFEIEKIAKKYNLKVIYDAAHAWGTTFNSKPLLNYGDISTCSFHATKIMHSGEGGAIICNNKTLFDKIFLLRQFGHIGDDYYSIGINGKSSELHAALGLCVLDDIEFIKQKRKIVCQQYDSILNFNKLFKPTPLENSEYNYAYYPVVFETEEILKNVLKNLAEIDIFPRRYFYPSLNNLPFLKSKTSCPVSEDISSRIICLPLSTYITKNDVEIISVLINKNL
jgi:dTDP-4-amino-4,6-dideoxygalactose transaminase